MSDVIFGATAAEWDAFVSILGPGPLLPVVCHPDAVISPRSTLKGLGKTPSLYNGEGYVTGITGWTSKVSTGVEVKAWRRQEDYGVCVQARGDGLRALDVDVDDPESAQEIYQLIRLMWGDVPIRGRNGAHRFLFPFRLTGLERLEKDVVTVAGGQIELLGDGQQWVAAGTHVKSGERYGWEPRDLRRIPTISVESLKTFWEATGGTWGGARRTGPEGGGSGISDDVVTALELRDLIRDRGKGGEVYFWCPWVADHTGDSGPTETVYYPAHTGGYVTGHFNCKHAHCLNKTDEDFRAQLSVGLEDFDDVSGEESPEEAPAPAVAPESGDVPMLRLDVADLLAPIKPARMVLPGVPAQAYTLIAGALSSYKSTTLDYLLLWKATGVDLLKLGGGQEIETGVAVRLTYEDTQDRIVERMSRIVQKGYRELLEREGQSAADRFVGLAARNLRYVPLSGQEKRGLTLKGARGVILRNEAWMGAVLERLRAEAPGGCLVGLDPLSLAAEGSQNDDEGAKTGVHLLNWFSASLGPEGAVVVCSHTTKAQASEPGSGYAQAAYATSGSGLWSQHARSNFHMARLSALEIRKLFPQLSEDQAERQQVVKMTHARLSHGEESTVSYFLQVAGTLEPIRPRAPMDAADLLLQGGRDIIDALRTAQRKWGKVTVEMLTTDETLRLRYSRDQLRTIIKALLTEGMLVQEGAARSAHLKVGKLPATNREILDDEVPDDISMTGTDD